MLETLHAWDSFYVIVGSSSAALTGLMFVVVTLMPEARRRVGGSEKTVAAFATPTIVDFCAALLVSAILSMPWSDLRQAGLAVAASGVLGLVYSGVVARRVSGSIEYRAEIVDWVWYVVLPTGAFLAMVVGGLLLNPDETGAMFPIAAATLALMFIGIHNSWDSVTYITFGMPDEPPKPEQKHDNKRHK
jgi:hypothetical protein